MAKRNPRSPIGTPLVLLGVATGLIALALPAGLVLGTPIRGYVLLFASLAAWAGPFGRWQDCYMALAAVVNIVLFVVLPISLLWGSRRALLAVITTLSAAYAISFAAIYPAEMSAASIAWLVANIFAAVGCLGRSTSIV